MPRRTAFVTGASRGIGKASALALARRGFDVVVTARTVREGEPHDHSATLEKTDTRPVPGSLETTATEIRALGADALPLRLDLLDSRSVEAAASEAVRRWGPMDVLVNNGIYTGPGTMDHLLDLPVEIVERIFEANVFAQLRLTRLLLDGMLERGSGTIIDMTSAVAEIDPPAPAGEGGWGLGYAASKGAFHRIVGFLHVELGGRGIRAFNVEPGYVRTERMLMDQMDAGFEERYPGAPPEVPGAVVAWLADEPGADEWRGKTVRAQKLCADLGLVPGWPAP